MMIDDIFDKLIYASEHPKKTIEDYMNRSGKKAIGCTPIYAPAELVHSCRACIRWGCGAAHPLVNATSAFFPPFILFHHAGHSGIRNERKLRNPLRNHHHRPPATR